MINEQNTQKKKIKRLSLSPILEYDGLMQGIKKDGRTYSVRKDRHRVFFPDEWIKFIDSLKPDNRVLFETLFITGARIEEALNIKVNDIFMDRNYIRLRVTKSKASKGENKERGGAVRSFVVSSQWIRRIKTYIADNSLNDNDLLFNYSKQGVWKLMRTKLKALGVKDWYNFSLHNIRKTHGMYLKTMIPYSREITEGEICLRLGHDFNTFLKHYGSPSIFSERDKQQIIKLLGDIYGLR